MFKNTRFLGYGLKIGRLYSHNKKHTPQFNIIRNNSTLSKSKPKYGRIIFGLSVFSIGTICLINKKFPFYISRREYSLHDIQKNPDLLKKVKNQTNEICLCAVKKDGLSLKYVMDKNPEICLAAVKSNGLALCYIPHKMRSRILCLEAIKNTPKAFCYVPNATSDILMVMIKRNPQFLSEIEYQTPEMCLAALERDPHTLKYVKNQTTEMCLAALEKDPHTLKYVKNQTPEMCIAAVQKDSLCLSYVQNPSREICRAAFLNDYNAIKYITFKEKFIEDMVNEKTNLNLLKDVELDGVTFNKITTGRKFIKISNGKNINETTESSYFIEDTKIEQLLSVHDCENNTCYQVSVTIPPDAKVHIGYDEISSDKIIMGQYEQINKIESD